MLATSAAFSVKLITVTPLNSRKPCKFVSPGVSFPPGKSFPRLIKLPSEKLTFELTRILLGDSEGMAGTFDQEALVHGHSGLATGGLEAILNNLSKWLVSAVFVVILLIRHDAEALWAAMGSVINSGISKLLKRSLNQERPVANLRSDPGMPSSHAQSIFYFVVFCVLSLMQWLGWNGLTTSMSGLIVLVGSYFTWLRVSQKLHTVSQVVVGALLGTIFGILWFWCWESVVLKAFISHMWIRALVIVGAAGFCVGFAVYVIRYWVMEEVTLHVSRKLQR